LQKFKKHWKKIIMGTNLKFGLLLPHFCQHASAEKCIEGAKKAEAFGFDSVWARDHLAFKPHEIDGSDNTHIEGLLVLASIASVTTKLQLGTAMAISHRHPIHLAQSFAGLSVISGGRVIMGLGLGGFPHEFAAAGYPSTLRDRAKLARINGRICRALWAGERVSYEDDYFKFADVALKPLPVKPIPIWAGGGTTASCRRAVEYCDGWMPARITLTNFTKRVEYLRELCQTAGRPMMTVAVMPLTSIAQEKKEALNKFKLAALLNDAQSFTSWVTAAPDTPLTLEDLRGLILAGTPEDIVRDTRAYELAGADHIVYDLRLRFGDWHEQLDILGKEVLPALRA
jgi:probable F420-dependent oxidoreductase